MKVKLLIDLELDKQQETAFEQMSSTQRALAFRALFTELKTPEAQIYPKWGSAFKVTDVQEVKE